MEVRNMYLKIVMEADGFHILEQSSRNFEKTATNGVHILTSAIPEIKPISRVLFLRGAAHSGDLRDIEYPSDGSFKYFLRALEEVIDSFVVCLR